MIIYDYTKVQNVQELIVTYTYDVRILDHLSPLSNIFPNSVICYCLCKKL